MDGHPASSKWNLFEAFAKNIIDLAQGNPKQWAETAIFVTVDEGGGYYDSGFIQPVDFFGNGPRIPMIAVSLYSTGGHVSHVYSEHSSFVKFIGRNWMLGTTLSSRSRENLPNPDPGGLAAMFRAICRRSAICLTSSTFKILASGLPALTRAISTTAPGSRTPIQTQGHGLRRALCAV